MSVPVWVLLGFAGWTVLTLLGSIGVYRWSQILTGRTAIHEFQADLAQGPEWYRRAMRAHTNCIENLPVYGAVVVAIVATGARSGVLDTLAIILIGARVLQTVTHIALPPTRTVAMFRFVFFFAQLVCMISMGIRVALAV